MANGTADGVDVVSESYIPFRFNMGTGAGGNDPYGLVAWEQNMVQGNGADYADYNSGGGQNVYLGGGGSNSSQDDDGSDSSDQGDGQDQGGGGNDVAPAAGFSWSQLTDFQTPYPYIGLAVGGLLLYVMLRRSSRRK